MLMGFTSSGTNHHIFLTYVDHFIKNKSSISLLQREGIITMKYVRGSEKIGWPLPPALGFSRPCPVRLELKKQRQDIREDRWAEAGELTWKSPHPHLPRSMLFEAFRLMDSGCLAGVTDLKLMCWSGKYTAGSIPELRKKARCHI